MKPSIGRIVHYTLPFAPIVHAPAIITRVLSETTVNLQVFYDAAQEAQSIVNPTSVEFDESGTVGGTWHWPEKV